MDQVVNNKIINLIPFIFLCLNGCLYHNTDYVVTQHQNQLRYERAELHYNREKRCHEMTSEIESIRRYCTDTNLQMTRFRRTAICRAIQTYDSMCNSTLVSE